MNRLDYYPAFCDNAHGMSNDGLRGSVESWYAFRVRSQNELKISSVFREKFGLTTKVPSQKLYRRRNGKKHLFTKPLLSSYVFALANLKNINRRLLFSISGVFGVLQAGDGPAAIPTEQITSLDKLSGVDKPVYEIDYSKMKPNERVEVVEGPLKGAVGNYLKINDKTGKLVVCMEIFQRTLVTEIEADLVKPY